MSIALIGIVIIQYRWIDNAVSEKQKLIDNNVYQAVDKVEQQLNDYRAMSFVMDTIQDETSMQVMAFGSDLDSLVTENIFTQEGSDSTVKMEIQVMTADQIENWEEETTEGGHFIHRKFEQHIEGDLDSISMVEIQEGLGHIESVINRIKLEVHSDTDFRLDSMHVEALLSDELEASGLGTIQDWGIWDNLEARYVVQPNLPHGIPYDIPLFTSDVLNPGRYDLRLRLDESDLIWSEIWPMILMSILFILIISVVFAFTVRLVVKHKRISAIKSDFINNMTHEFKTPLASISLAADSLLHPNNELNKENVEKYVEIIKQEKNKLNNHVERILEVAALSKGSLEISIDRVNADEVLQKALDKFQMQVEKGLVVINKPKTSGLTVQANPFHLENVLVNLIENGIKYSDDSAELVVDIDSNSSSITVQDKGIGMDQKQLSKVFDNFYRAESGNLHSTKGFGLGLSYCKLVIEKMGGEILLQSKPGEGTTATIKLAKA